jgi:3-deoxy-manno-octulosonate cytidylyltransferase (CMP-KDO synthetase)
VTDSSFKIVIPARYESTRLPGKVLLDIGGKPMVQHVWDRANESGASSIVIATDHAAVAEAATAFGAEVCLTSVACQSGTDRAAEVCAKKGWADDTIVVNVQGDAPLMPASSIKQVATLLGTHSHASVSTACTAIQNEREYLDPNVVKVVLDHAGGALYFSRAPIPAAGHNRDNQHAWQSSWRHLGLYGYRVKSLQQLSSTPPCELELTERLEQLRAMWLGMHIQVAIDDAAHGPDVDTEDDLLRVADLLQAMK